MGKIINLEFPDKRTVKREVITGYKVANGESILLTDSGKVDENDNKIIEVSHKPENAERYENIINMEDWKRAKGYIVKDVHNQRDTFEYMTPEEITLVTEDFAHNLAVKNDTLASIVANFEEYLKSRQTTIEETPEINPFAAQEIVSPEVAEEPQAIIPEITPAPIVDAITPAPEMVQSAPIGTNIVEFPGAENTNLVQEQNTIVDTPSVAPIIEENKVVDFPQQQVVQNNTSSVENAYIENINALIEQMKKITDEFIKQMEHMKNVSIEEFKQIKDLRQLAEDTVKRAESVMATANNNNYNEEQQQVLTKVA